MEYFVYALIKNEKPIYVGCTSGVISRIKQHKKSKDFDTYVIIEKFDNKHDALICERGIIKFISLQNDDNNVNGKYDRFVGCSMYGYKI
jgi:predicted GIY-YIG superfamily endonuclease